MDRVPFSVLRQNGWPAVSDRYCGHRERNIAAQRAEIVRQQEAQDGLELDHGPTADDALQLGRVADEGNRLATPNQAGGDLHVLLPVEVDQRERGGDEL